jgi:DNA-binding sugar fermentation-stimulating protein
MEIRWLEAAPIHADRWTRRGKRNSSRLPSHLPKPTAYNEARTDTTQQSGQTPDKKVEIKNITVSVIGYIGARTDTTQQSGQTPNKKVEIKNITVYVIGYIEARTDTTQQSGQTPDKKVEIKNITVYIHVY